MLDLYYNRTMHESSWKLWIGTYVKIMKAVNKFELKNVRIKKYTYLCYMRAFFINVFPIHFSLKIPLLSQTVKEMTNNLMNHDIIRSRYWRIINNIRRSILSLQVIKKKYSYVLSTINLNLLKIIITL